MRKNIKNTLIFFGVVLAIALTIFIVQQMAFVSQTSRVIQFSGVPESINNGVNPDPTAPIKYQYSSTSSTSTINTGKNIFRFVSSFSDGSMLGLKDPNGDVANICIQTIQIFKNEVPLYNIYSYNDSNGVVVDENWGKPYNIYDDDSTKTSYIELIMNKGAGQDSNAAYYHNCKYATNYYKLILSSDSFDINATPISSTTQSLQVIQLDILNKLTIPVSGILTVDFDSTISSGSQHSQYTNSTVLSPGATQHLLYTIPSSEGMISLKVTPKIDLSVSGDNFQEFNYNTIHVKADVPGAPGDCCKCDGSVGGTCLQADVPGKLLPSDVIPVGIISEPATIISFNNNTIPSENTTTFYRLANNTCSMVLISPSQQTAQDFTTNTLCQAMISVPSTNPCDSLTCLEGYTCEIVTGTQDATCVEGFNYNILWIIGSVVVVIITIIIILYIRKKK